MIKAGSLLIELPLLAPAFYRILTIFRAPVAAIKRDIHQSQSHCVFDG